MRGRRTKIKKRKKKIRTDIRVNKAIWIDKNGVLINDHQFISAEL